MISHRLRVATRIGYIKKICEICGICEIEKTAMLNVANITPNYYADYSFFYGTNAN